MRLQQEALLRQKQQQAIKGNNSQNKLSNNQAHSNSKPIYIDIEDDEQDNNNKNDNDK